MAKININFSVKSIKNAMGNLQKIEDALKNLAIQRFLLKSANRIVELSNLYLMRSEIDIGSQVKDQIIAGWQPPRISDNKVVVENTEDRAMFIEFGVGIIGKQSGYNSNTNNANINGYEYDYESGKKKKDRSWVFENTGKSSLDIKEYYVLNEFDGSDNKMYVRTKGQPAQLYVYNALLDFKESGEAQRLWNETLSEVLR